MEELAFYFATKEEFKTLKLSVSKNDDKYVLGNNISNVYIGKPQVPYGYIICIQGEKKIWTHGEFISDYADLSNYVTKNELNDNIDTSNLFLKSNAATINGKSITNGGNIEIDASIYKVVTSLPTENILLDKIYLMKSDTSTSLQTNFDCWKYENNEWINQGPFGSVKIDLSQYLSKSEADQRYMIKSSNAKSSLIVLDNGQVNNLGNNGQAYNAIREVTAKDYNGETGSGYPINCASFGVKLDGTTAFSHKKYDSYTYDKSNNTDKSTGAKNTAVLVFSGRSGLLYAKNTGSANDVTAQMYRRVGVIDSPDDAQKVYSAAQTDSQINALIQSALVPIVNNYNDQINELKYRIEDLENQNNDLYTKIELLLQKCNVTEEELNSIEPRNSRELIGGSMIDMIQEETNDILSNLRNNINDSILKVTTDYSKLSDEVDENMTDV